MDNYAKDGGPAAVWLLCNFYHHSLPSSFIIITSINNLSSYGYQIKIDAQLSNLKLICDYQLYDIPGRKVKAAKDHGKKYLDIPCSAIFSVIVYHGVSVLFAFCSAFERKRKVQIRLHKTEIPKFDW